MKSKKSKVATMVFILACLILAGCTRSDSDQEEGPSGPTPIFKGTTLVNYASCSDLKADLKEVYVEEMEAEFKRMEASCKGGWLEAEDVAGASPTIGDNRGPSYTDTNVQEVGVDEADLIKTDGTHVYSIVNHELKIAKVWPFESFGKVASIVPAGDPKGLYLVDKRLVIISSAFSYDYWLEMAGGIAEPTPDIYLPEESVTVEVYDMSSPASPQLINETTYKGSLIDSRRVGSFLHFLTSNQIAGPELDYFLDMDWDRLPECPEEGEPAPTSELLQAIDVLRQKNQKIIDEFDFSYALSQVSNGNAEEFCRNVSRSSASLGKAFLSLMTDDLSDSNGVIKTTAILGNGGTVYTSPDNIYVASTLSPYFYLYYYDQDAEEETIIHRFSLVGVSPTYKGSSAVPGHLVDNSYVGSRHSSRFSMAQFAMSEYEGHLRVATTLGHVSRFGEDGSDNLVSVIDISQAELPVVGQVTGLGKGERIYAVRFMKDRGFVVTFKKVDPLYVLDLTEPTNPQVKGELKIPGFSTYLHPYKNDLIIGLGFDADDQGDFAWTQGLKLSLFDVSDPTDPIEVGHRVIGSRGTYSTAVEEHHAFTLDLQRNLLALPIDMFVDGEGGSDYGEYSFSGVMLFNVDAGGKFSTAGEFALDIESDGYWNPSSVLRTVILGDDAYSGIVTLTPDALYLHRIGDTVGLLGVVK